VFPVFSENDTMFPSRRLVIARYLFAGLLLVASGPQAVLASDESPEHEQLAALVRQLDMIDRLAEHAAQVSPQDHARYHFDCARLREDVQRVRAGIQDYLIPLRAQPRDPTPLVADYKTTRLAPKESP
jgi:RAQPRD family integrative conjugative element protein